MKKMNVKGYFGKHFTEIVNIIIAAITLCIAFMSFRVANMSYNMAQNAYKHDSSNYSANLSIIKEDNNIYIKNNDTDLFEVNSIEFVKAEKFIISKDNVTFPIEINTTDCSFRSDSENLIDLNDIRVDTSKRKALNNKDSFSENDEILFNNTYKNKLSELQQLYNVRAGETAYYINIWYFNKYTYEEKNLNLMVYPGDEGEIRNIYPGTRNSAVQIDLINTYQQINDEWGSIINQINDVLKYNRK